jgi:antitoxin component HigA of HigAB toxin-antitoxin module
MTNSVLNAEVDYEEALDAIHRLANRPRGKLTPKERERLDDLRELIAAYDVQKPARDLSRMRGLKTLKSLMTNAGMTASNLGRLLGDRALGARILNGKRKLDQRHIRILADHFHISSDVLMPTS